MKNKLITILLLIITGSLFAQELPDAKELLKASDKKFIPQRCSFQMKLENYEDNAVKNWMLMDCFVDGEDRYLLVFKDPGIMRGQTQLRLGSTIYSYVRRINRVQQVSARLSFQNSILSQEDIMSSTLASFYTVENVEKITSSEGRALYSMSLVSKSKKVAYARIVSFVDAKTLVPVSRMYYASSGKLIKEMVIEDIVQVNGVIGSVRFRLTDSLRPQNYAIVTMDTFNEEADLPANMFSQQYMRAAAR